MTLLIDSTSSNVTEQLGEKLGRRLKGGEVIELLSDLGGGKTTFVIGLVKGIGSTDHVSSPTFTISKRYQGPRFSVQHFDFYRLPTAGIVGDELQEELQDKETVVVIEWGAIIRDVLPVERLTISFAPVANDENKRQLSFEYPAALAYLVSDLKEVTN